MLFGVQELKPRASEMADNDPTPRLNRTALATTLGAAGIAAIAGFASVYVTVGRPDNAVRPTAAAPAPPQAEPKSAAPAGPGANPLSHGAPEDEAAALDPDDGVDALPFVRRGEQINRGLEPHRVAQQRRDVVEEDAGLWKIRNVANVLFEVHAQSDY